MAPPGPLQDPVARRQEWRAWYFYDWANSAFLTTVAAVLLGPYVTAMAERAACGFVATAERKCTDSISVLGVDVAPGSLWLYSVALTTFLAAVLLPVVGALIDRRGHKRVTLAALAWTGSGATCLLLFTGGSGWPVVVGLAMVAALCAGGATVAYNAILNDIAGPADRDGVSSRGWALGYLGAGVLLVVNIVYLGVAQVLGMDLEAAARVCFVTAGLWWGGWTLIPFLRLSDRPRIATQHHSRGLVAGLVRHTGRASSATWPVFPETVRFLAAYIFFNAGIQVVLASGSVYATRELGHPQTLVIAALICVQFVAAPGALLLGRLADRHGAKRVVLGSLVVWALVTAGAAVVPAGDAVSYIALAATIGLVVGGSQALARSMYSRLIPVGREAEFFGLYQTADRGTSWIGTLMFGVVFQVTGDYRLAMASTAGVFVVGFLLLARVDLEQGARAVLAAAPSGARPQSG